MRLHDNIISILGYQSRDTLYIRYKSIDFDQSINMLPTATHDASTISTEHLDNPAALPLRTSLNIVEKAMAPKRKAAKNTKAGRKASKTKIPAAVQVVLDPLSEEAVHSRCNRIAKCACQKFLLCNTCNDKYKPMDGTLKPEDLCLDERYKRDTRIQAGSWEDDCHSDGIGHLPCVLCHEMGRYGRWNNCDADHGFMLREADMCPHCLIKGVESYKRCNGCNVCNQDGWCD
jgi:hypothetical protein